MFTQLTHNSRHSSRGPCSFTVTDSDHTRRAFHTRHTQLHFPRFVTAPAAKPSANAAATTTPLVPRSSPARDAPGLATSARQARALRDVYYMVNDGNDVNDFGCELEGAPSTNAPFALPSGGCAGSALAGGMGLPLIASDCL
jgi:hypothetical protein